MLTELHIRDFAIIDELTLVCGPGFVVFTGETGAGKSILIDAVEVLLGGRAEVTMIRSEAPAALIEGTFTLGPGGGEAARRLLEAEGLLEEAETLVLSREIRREGRTVGRVNGRAVSVSLLRSLGEFLVDVHGQSEHLSLLRVREHLSLLDRYAQVEGLRREFSADYSGLESVRRELKQLREAERDASRRSELLAFQVNEIEAASLRPGEEVELLEERVRLANAEQLASLAEKAVAALDETVENRSSATDRLGEVPRRWRLWRGSTARFPVRRRRRRPSWSRRGIWRAGCGSTGRGLSPARSVSMRWRNGSA
jgi:DNA repair protein RecN (Recombination protein N)